MKLLKYSKFLEVNLNIGILGSERDGEPRGNKLVKKLKDKEPKLNVDGQEVEIDLKNAKKIVKSITNSDGKYDNTDGVEFFKKGNRYEPVIKPANSNIVLKLNDIKKDKDFGSSGPGVTTRDYENLQCLFLAHKIIRPNVILNGDNIVKLLAEYNEDGSEIAKNFGLHLPNIDNLDKDLVKLLNTIEKRETDRDRDWWTTLTSVTNSLFNFESRGVKLFLKKNLNNLRYSRYDIYHVSVKNSPFSLLKRKFNNLSKEESKGGKERIEFSKYCPADVIIVANNLNISTLIDGVKTIDELTDVMNVLFIQRELIPISLKKVGIVKGVEKFNIIVNNEIERDLPEFEMSSISIYNDINRGIGSKINVKSKWKDGKGITFDEIDRTLVIDSSNTSNNVNVDGEVQGDFSRHGKISHSYMKKFINDVASTINLKLDEIQTQSELKKYDIDLIINKIGDIQTKLENIKDKGKLRIDYPVGRLINENKENKLISKLQALQIVYAIVQINNVSPLKCKEVINKIMRYALSIKADNYKTPRYIRVI